MRSPMPHTIEHAGLTDVGRVREENQDRWFADPTQGLYIVADGMGGSVSGALAAEVVVSTLPPLLRKQLGNIDDLSSSDAPTTVVAALAQLSDQLRRQSHGQPGLQGMGSTVVLAFVHGMHALVGHMGDSRAYLLRGGSLEQLTKDHSIVQLLLDSGDIRPEEAAEHPSRGQLTRFVGMEGEALPEARLVQIRPGDLLLLCSDGLTGMVGDNAILRICKRKVRPRTLCRRLIGAANAAGGKDNVTAVVVRIAQSPAPETKSPENE